MKKFYNKMIIIVIFLFITIITKVNAQATDGMPLTGNFYGPLKYLGWATNILGQDLNFNMGGIGGTQMMTLQGGTGFLGINNPFPNFLLDVNLGDINITSAMNGYCLGGTAPFPQITRNEVLQYRGLISNLPLHISTTNIFVGVGAGINNIFTVGTPNLGASNTFVGHNAGYSNVTGSHNTAVGAGAMEFGSVAVVSDVIRRSGFAISSVLL